MVILLAGILFSATAGQKNWSVDLHGYGMKEWRGKDGELYRPTVRVAATNNVVAVALENPTASEASNERDNIPKPIKTSRMCQGLFARSWSRLTWQAKTGLLQSLCPAKQTDFESIKTEGET
ncbi:MAG TPA: hypothetical protein VN982_16705 [Candidatus Dormibacteraeota bacterium]|nr:hypothetical protein [Candidatus Dormibacteraeota bacterium]